MIILVQINQNIIEYFILSVDFKNKEAVIRDFWVVLKSVLGKETSRNFKQWKFLISRIMMKMVAGELSRITS